VRADRDRAGGRRAGPRFPVASLLALLALVSVTGIGVSWLATAAITRAPLLPALRAE